MTTRHIERDYSAHRKSVIRPYDEYVELEIFSFDPKFTRTYVADDNTLPTGQNTSKTFYKAWSCYKSADLINNMIINFDYGVLENGEYRIDILYEQSNHINDDAQYNTGSNLTGHIKVNNDSFDIINEDILFDGENNVLKRKTIYTSLLNGNHHIELQIPYNCFIMGVIIRKIIKFVGDNYYGSSLGSERGNLVLTNATISNSAMTKPTELQCTIFYDDRLECDESPSGFYIDYMDECNFYVKNDKGKVERVFGGYVSSILPNADRTTLSINGADRLVDGQNKYILDEMKLLGGTKDINEDEYTDGMTKDFNNYPQALKYLCDIHEVTLNSNISQDWTVDGEKFNKGLSLTYGTDKKIKSIPVTNGMTTPSKNYIMLRNNSKSDKVQQWTLYDAKTSSQVPPKINVGSESYMHITYGLGGKKTEYKTKTSEKVDTSETTAGSQKFGKCGVSQDKKYIMAIGKVSGSKKTSLSKNKLYKTIFKNKCPYCGGELVWDSGRTDTKCVYCGGYNGSKRTWGDISETEITCKKCCSDFDAVTGYEKISSPKKHLEKVSNSVESSKSEQDKLHNGNMVAVPKTGLSLSPESIFRAIANLGKKYKYRRNSGSSTWTSMKKTGYGDCHAWSEMIFDELKHYDISCRIVQYRTNLSDTHQSVIYKNDNGKWVDFPYKDYGFDKNLYPTSGSLKSNTQKINSNNGVTIGKAVAKSTSTSKNQTTTITHTRGYDNSKPINGYLKLVVSTEQSFNAIKHELFVKFTLPVGYDLSLNSGLNLYWINNTIKQATLQQNIKQYLDTNLNGDFNYYLHQIFFITPTKTATTSNEDIDWYKQDNQTDDESSCKLNLYQITFDNNKGAEPHELNACGKSVNTMLQDLVKDAGYYVDMTYGLHRSDDRINFHILDERIESYVAREGDENNILNWNNIAYSPVSSLYNNSVEVFKNVSDNHYYYVNTRDAKSILNYGEQTTLTTNNSTITIQEAYFNAVMNDKLNPEQTYTYTITVPNYPTLKIGDMVRVVANAKKLNTIKEVKSIKVTFDNGKIPRIQTELGLDELAPDIQLKENIRNLRRNAKKEDTSFDETAIPVTDKRIYEWDR